jgi:hypothetical protein
MIKKHFLVDWVLSHKHTIEYDGDKVKAIVDGSSETIVLDKIEYEKELTKRLNDKRTKELFNKM